MIRKILATAAAAAALALAAPAHADEDGYLNYLREKNWTGQYMLGQPILQGVVVSPENAIAAGRNVCNQLHTGLSRVEILAAVPASHAGNQSILIDAAQHELCPDTLG